MSSSTESSISALQQAFRDPTSPFYIPEGEVGLASPGDHAQSVSPIASSAPELDSGKEAREYALNNGYDPDSFYEHKVMWGEMDSFRQVLNPTLFQVHILQRDTRHVNNVQYARYIESSRLQWITSLYQEVGGPAAIDDFLAARGIGLILKSLSIDYKRPLTYSDTILIAHRLAPINPPSTTRFKHEALIYSYSQRAVAATGESVLVWYDYGKLQKSQSSDEMRAAIEDRMKRQQLQLEQQNIPNYQSFL